ncbi:MAG: hypothetical protein R3208_11175 [Ketobacteraceae bacterium]|nr:hypothetical protein [Ketobacteraceae bacterium]
MIGISLGLAFAIPAMAEAPPVITTSPLQFEQNGSTADIPVVQTDPLRFSSREDSSGIPVVRVDSLRFSAREEAIPVVTVPALRFAAREEPIPVIRAPALRFGTQDSAIPVVTVPALRFGTRAQAAPVIVTAPLRFGSQSGSVPVVQTVPLRFGTRSDAPAVVRVPPLRFGTSDSGREREVTFELVRVTPLDPDNAIKPFDYRDVIASIDEATTPAGEPQPEPDPDPEPEPDPEPVALTFTGVPVDFVFSASLNFVPSVDPQQWSVTEGPDNSTLPDAAFGFWAGGFTSGGYELEFQAGMGWSSPELPTTLVLADENFGFETRTVTFELTRLSDGRRFSVTADVSAGSDGDISVSAASGWDCFTNTGGCP